MLQTIVTYPPVTKLLLVGFLVPVVLEYLSFTNYISYAYIPRLVAEPYYQYHRILTSFLYSGPISINFVMQVFFFLSRSEFLETSTPVSVNVPRQRQNLQRSLNYCWFLLICTSVIFFTGNYVSVFSKPSPPKYFSKTFADALLYVWCRKNTDMQVMLLGMVGLSASYLPLLYLGLDLPRLLNVVLSSDTTVWNIWGKSFQVIKFYILSMFVGHALWWLEDVATLLWGVRVLTPPWEMLESAKAMIQVEETEVAEEVEVAEEGEEAEVLEVLEVVEGRVVEEVEVVEVVEEVEEMEGQEMAMN